MWEKESVGESEIEECERECVLGSVSEKEGEYEREIRERAIKRESVRERECLRERVCE